MDLRQYLRILREQWWLIALCVLLGVGASAAVVWTATPKYTAHIQLFVSTKDSTNAQAAYQGGLFGQQRVKSYADIISSDKVVSAVKQQLKLQPSVSELQGEITASAPLDTVLINVNVTDTIPARAADIANAIGTQFSVLVNQLETPQGETVSPVKVTTVEPATAPSSPSSPNKKLDLALGILVGLVVGVAAAVLREVLNTTIVSRDQAVDLAHAPVLAAFLEDDKVRSRPLIVAEDSFSPRAEAFRQLRTNIRFLSVDDGVRSLVVTSSVSGEGKTTVAVNLALALAQNGERVILVDADLRRPQVAEILGLNPQGGLTSVLVERSQLSEALQTWRPGVSLQVLTSGDVPPNPSEMLGSQRMQELVHQLRDQSTIVVFDSPPLLPVTDAAVLTALTDGALLVGRVGKTRRDAFATSAEALRRVGGNVLGVVLNRVPQRRKDSTYGYGYGYGYTDAVHSEPVSLNGNGVHPDSQPAQTGVSAR